VACTGAPGGRLARSSAYRLRKRCTKREWLACRSPATNGGQTFTDVGTEGSTAEPLGGLAVII
jgi:hypothetical protein